MKLNLRDLFWLTFVAAVLTMWWMDRSKLADRLSFYETPSSLRESFVPLIGTLPGPDPYRGSPAVPTLPKGFAEPGEPNT